MAYSFFSSAALGIGVGAYVKTYFYSWSCSQIRRVFFSLLSGKSCFTLFYYQVSRVKSVSRPSVRRVSTFVLSSFQSCFSLSSPQVSHVSISLVLMLVLFHLCLVLMLVLFHLCLVLRLVLVLFSRLQCLKTDQFCVDPSNYLMYLFVTPFDKTD